MNYPDLEKLVTRSKLIGADQSLVVYGGGNTSAKGEITDYLGRNRSVLWVKGSGADMAYGEAVDYPALYLDELSALKSKGDLDDDTMVDFVTRALLIPVPDVHQLKLCSMLFCQPDTSIMFMQMRFVL